MAPTQTRFIAVDAEAEQLLPVLTELASAARPRRRAIRVRVHDGGSSARDYGRPRLDIGRRDIDQPWTRGVLAHEFGHLVDPVGIPAGLSIVGIFFGLPTVLLGWLALPLMSAQEPGISGPMSVAVMLMTPLVLAALAISRRAESRADGIAASLLEPDPSPLLAMLDHFAKMPGRRPARRWLSTHPHPRDRHAAISSRLQVDDGSPRHPRL